MQNAWRCVPARAQLDPVSPGQLRDARVAVVPIAQAGLNLFFTHPRVKPEIGQGEFARIMIQLNRVIVRFRLARPTQICRGLIPKMEMVEERQPVIKEFGVHGPGMVGFIQERSDQIGAQFLNCIAE